METKHNLVSIESTFKTGIAGIFLISGGIYRTFLSNKVSVVSIIASILFTLLVFIFKVDFYILILEIKDILIIFLPSILGFTIAGYSLVVGFIHNDMLSEISEPAENSKFSLYQKMSSAFALNIIFQAIALIIAYLIHFVEFIEKHKTLKFSLPVDGIKSINFIGLIFISYWFIISVLLVIQIIINIFNFSQLHHYFVNKTKIAKLNPEKSNKENSDTKDVI